MTSCHPATLPPCHPRGARRAAPSDGRNLGNDAQAGEKAASGAPDGNGGFLRKRGHGGGPAAKKNYWTDRSVQLRQDGQAERIRAVRSAGFGKRCASRRKMCAPPGGKWRISAENGGHGDFSFCNERSFQNRSVSALAPAFGQGDRLGGRQALFAQGAQGHGAVALGECRRRRAGADDGGSAAPAGRGRPGAAGGYGWRRTGRRRAPRG